MNPSISSSPVSLRTCLDTPLAMMVHPISRASCPSEIRSFFSCGTSKTLRSIPTSPTPRTLVNDPLAHLTQRSTSMLRFLNIVQSANICREHPLSNIIVFRTTPWTSHTKHEYSSLISPLEAHTIFDESITSVVYACSCLTRRGHSVAKCPF